MNRTQIQTGPSVPEFSRRYITAMQHRTTFLVAHRSDSFACTNYGGNARASFVREALRDGKRACHARQRSLTSGDNSELTLTRCFLSIQLFNRVKHKRMRMQAATSHAQDLELSGTLAQRWWRK